ncbi:hypothetical protein ACFSO7_01635 [Bacillus sp. CGMCC 1.16607]|uniref:hypothetical protein n=1 Tax=Bacillus sp. CGMCC 1.16607 TaxID=3351842 RepID=UPI0036320DF2
MNELVQFIKISNALLEHMEKGLPEESREEFIQVIHELLEKRQMFLDSLPDLTNILDLTVKHNLLETEKRIQALLSSFSENIKEDLKMLQLKKKKNNHYANPYGDISADGMFLDKRK